jgi:hypothetical protein
LICAIKARFDIIKKIFRRVYFHVNLSINDLVSPALFNGGDIKSDFKDIVKEVKKDTNKDIARKFKEMLINVKQ